MISLTAANRRGFVGLGVGAAFGLLGASATAAPVLWDTGAGGNGHYYEYVATGASFGAALLAADAAVLAGYDSYLATVTSSAENSFIASLVQGAGPLGPTWVAGSDADTEGVWKWVAGPETGMVFWNGGPGGSSPAGAYANFQCCGEPNNNGEEDGVSAFYFGSLTWNDQNVGAANGYVVEYSLAPTAVVPEPGAWALMILGFGGVGAALRRRHFSIA